MKRRWKAELPSVSWQCLTCGDGLRHRDLTVVELFASLHHQMHPDHMRCLPQTSNGSGVLTMATIHNFKEQLMDTADGLYQVHHHETDRTMFLYRNGELWMTGLEGHVTVYKAGEFDVISKLYGPAS